jgi:molybdopterin synthase sulfur carrier subunit
MHVDVYATLRDIAGGKRVELGDAGGTVRALLEALFERHPALRPELFASDGTMHPHVHVFVNGRDVQYLAGELDAPVPEGAKVDVFPAVGGG